MAMPAYSVLDFISVDSKEIKTKTKKPPKKQKQVCMMAENLFATVQNGPHHLFGNPLPAASLKPSHKAPPKNKRRRQIEKQKQAENQK